MWTCVKKNSRRDTGLRLLGEQKAKSKKKKARKAWLDLIATKSGIEGSKVAVCFLPFAFHPNGKQQKEKSKKKRLRSYPRDAC